jgi:hypothetical protein
LRVGRHRIVYKPDDDGIAIAAIGPRSTVYEDTARLLARRRKRRR